MYERYYRQDLYEVIKERLQEMRYGATTKGEKPHNIYIQIVQNVTYRL